MELKIISEKGVVLKTKVKKVLLPGMQGDFMILPNHAPTVAYLAKGKIKYLTTSEQNKELEITGGLAEVSRDKTVAFIEY